MEAVDDDSDGSTYAATECTQTLVFTHSYTHNFTHNHPQGAIEEAVDDDSYGSTYAATQQGYMDADATGKLRL